MEEKKIPSPPSRPFPPRTTVSTRPNIPVRPAVQTGLQGGKEETKVDKEIQQQNVNLDLGKKITQTKDVERKQTKEPLSNQSKGILFGLLGGFSLVCAIVFFVLMFIL